MKKQSKNLKICKSCHKKAFVVKNKLKKYCSRSCSIKAHNKKRMAIRRELILFKGGKCEICGYKRNISALCFHHRDPNKKEMSMNIGKFALSGKVNLFKEVKKCQLLCANCHAEVHNEDLNIY